MKEVEVWVAHLSELDNGSSEPEDSMSSLPVNLRGLVPPNLLQILDNIQQYNTIHEPGIGKSNQLVTRDLNEFLDHTETRVLDPVGGLGDPTRLIRGSITGRIREGSRLNGPLRGPNETFREFLRNSHDPANAERPRKRAIGSFLLFLTTTTTTQGATIVAPATLTIVRWPLGCDSWSWLCAGPAAAVSATAAEDHNDLTDHDHNEDDNDADERTTRTRGWSG
ncbi:hypothetical protein BDZ89DRAFT_1244211 [Hymenopellis radicata]|nr:hypothetical protein BDZ89DRAFT_1244211 [Hymenopellis radicata]